MLRLNELIRAIQLEKSLHQFVPSEELPFAAVGLILHEGCVLGVTRRGNPSDWGLPGGKLAPGESAYDAFRRELSEETGVTDVEGEAVFERVDEHGNVTRCYLVTGWSGEPHRVEEGVHVAWLEPERLLEHFCTFKDYNRKLLEHLKILPKKLPLLR